MKRHGNLYESLTSFENLYVASIKARRGKRMKEGCATFEMNREAELWRLHHELRDGTWKPGAYREFTIYERTPRKISAAPYRDRVVHHAICNIIEPIFDRCFIHDTYACRTGKGTHAALERFTHFAAKSRYVLKSDIRKYFPSIDHEILKNKIRRKIKCRPTIALIDAIIDGSNPQDEVNSHFPGDGLFTPFQRKCGIPIGNLTSQFFANLYLDALDHFVTEQLNPKGYIRYVDDVTLFDDDKGRLWEMKSAMSAFLEADRLSLHPRKTFVQPLTEGTDHVCYMVFPDRRLMRKDVCRRFVRRLKKLGPEDAARSIVSWLGHAKWADASGLAKSVGLIGN
ncbi:MAG: RNA-directed DNA polymerase [Deltaproteobacteria bacterium]|nr:RNA-directed DNA polymerase [Deltaproteobacteria bacterium]